MPSRRYSALNCYPEREIMGPSPNSTRIPGNLLGQENTEVQPGAADSSSLHFMLPCSSCTLSVRSSALRGCVVLRMRAGSYIWNRHRVTNQMLLISIWARRSASLLLFLSQKTRTLSLLPNVAAFQRQRALGLFLGKPPQHQTSWRFSYPVNIIKV